MLYSFSVKSYNGRRPFDIEVISQRFSTIFDTQRYYVFIDETNYSIIRIRNCIHLLTTDSPGVKKIKQYILIFSASLVEGRSHLGFPLDLIFHSHSSYTKYGFIWSEHKCQPSKLNPADRI